MRKIKKYTITYEVQIEGENLDEGGEMAEARGEELKKKARLKAIKGENECWERFYND
jgi:hypothetical protein